MRIERHKPMVRRGVTQLMYVGDDDAVDAATGPAPINWRRVAKIAGVVWAAMWVLSGISPPAPKPRFR